MVSMKSSAKEPLIRVMSFNIWRSGGRSLEATIDAIRLADVDVIGLQECRVETGRTIAKELELDWVDDEAGHVIASRFPIDRRIGTTDSEWGGLGATIRIGRDRTLHIFDAHLHWIEYGPYYLREGKEDAFIVERERAIRMPGLDELLDMMSPYLDEERAKREPVFLVGDFNAPSHLDYVTLKWPTSVACEEVGLVDSYRALHAPRRRYDRTFSFDYDEPGITWTPLPEEEPHGAFDRIDFVYAKGRATPVESSELDGRTGPATWPSDHRAVVSSFSVY